MMIYLMMIDSPQDRSKFEKLYREYRGLMYQVAYEILHNEQDAEDAVHQAFVKIAEHIEKIEDAICPKTKGYVVTVIESKSIDLYRYKQRHPTEELSEDALGITIDYDGPNILAKCMAKLPANQRTVLLLKHLHGFSNREAGKIMGMTEANVIKLHQRGKSRLCALCKEEGLL